MDPGSHTEPRWAAGNWVSLLNSRSGVWRKDEGHTERAQVFQDIKTVWSFHSLAAHDSRYSNMADSYRHFPNHTVLLKRKKAQERLNKWINLISWLLKIKIFTEPPSQAHRRQWCHLTGTCHTGAACPWPKACGVCGNLKKLLLQSGGFLILAVVERKL